MKQQISEEVRVQRSRENEYRRIKEQQNRKKGIDTLKMKILKEINIKKK